jgi:hypothetical protein
MARFDSATPHVRLVPWPEERRSPGPNETTSATEAVTLCNRQGRSPLLGPRLTGDASKEKAGEVQVSLALKPIARTARKYSA